MGYGMWVRVILYHSKRWSSANGVIMQITSRAFLSALLFIANFSFTTHIQSFETHKWESSSFAFQNTIETYCYEKKAPLSELLSTLVGRARYLTSFKEELSDSFFTRVFTRSSRITPTEAHLIMEFQTGLFNSEFFNIQNNDVIADYLKYENLRDTATQINDLQKQCNESADLYYSYVHAHHWSLDLTQKIYAEFHTQTDSFFPLHFLTLLDSSIPENSEQALVTSLLKYGRNKDSKQKFLLSMNASFFANCWDVFECTAYYFANNISISTHAGQIRELFRAEGYEDVYKNHQKEFEMLEYQHSQCSKHGKVWVIMVPKSIHKDVVIVTGQGAHPLKMLIDNDYTNDVDLIQETLCTRPHAMHGIDHMQFRMIMTPSTGLNPTLGIKMVPLHCADPIKYAEFEQALKVVMDKVKSDIASKKSSVVKAINN